MSRNAWRPVSLLLFRAWLEALRGVGWVHVRKGISILPRELTQEGTPIPCVILRDGMRSSRVSCPSTVRRWYGTNHEAPPLFAARAFPTTTCKTNRKRHVILGKHHDSSVTSRRKAMRIALTRARVATPTQMRARALLLVPQGTNIPSLISAWLRRP